MIWLVYLKTRCIKGSKKAAVFPEPVMEVPRTSFPERIAGMLISWISVGNSKEISLRDFSKGLQMSFFSFYLSLPTRICFFLLCLCFWFVFAVRFGFLFWRLLFQKDDPNSTQQFRNLVWFPAALLLKNK